MALCLTAIAQKQSSKTLVAYFSATGTTEKAAKVVAEVTGGTLYEIQPAKKYTSADLDWHDKSSREGHLVTSILIFSGLLTLVTRCPSLFKMLSIISKIAGSSSTASIFAIVSLDSIPIFCFLPSGLPTKNSIPY